MAIRVSAGSSVLPEAFDAFFLGGMSRYNGWTVEERGYGESYGPPLSELTSTRCRFQTDVVCSVLDISHVRVCIL